MGVNGTRSCGSGIIGRMASRYDLHTHSTASDGTLEPAELVRQAAQAGVEVLALTDHDTLDGLADADVESASHDLRLVPGVEISVTWSGLTVHLLGLGVDPGDMVLQKGLASLQEFRRWRAEEIARQLEKKGIDGALEGARSQCMGRLLSRTHFARFLVQRGYAASVSEVFRRYLVKGKPGHVTGRWASLEQALEWVRGAGGVGVIAHPARYRLTRSKLERLIDEFRGNGGLGLEVVSGSHNRDETLHMAALSRVHGLYASCGSDFHTPDNRWITLGRLDDLPRGCTPIWESGAFA